YLNTPCPLVCTLSRRSSQLSFFFLYCSGHPRDLHSFPTRRSSDLATADSLPDLAASAPEVMAKIEAVNSGAETLQSVADLAPELDRKSTRLNSSHVSISYAVFCLKKKKEKERQNAAKRKATRGHDR